MHNHAAHRTGLNEAQQCGDIKIELINETIVSAQKNPDATIQAMQDAANAFYRDAVAIGNHPFIEFAGLMNEYIHACREAAASGIDFTSCNTHTGQHLPLHDHQVDYINEKLECIFTGRSVVSAEVLTRTKNYFRISRTKPS